jgi:hypothetical protein
MPTLIGALMRASAEPRPRRRVIDELRRLLPGRWKYDALKGTWQGAVDGHAVSVEVFFEAHFAPRWDDDEHFESRPVAYIYGTDRVTGWDLASLCDAVRRELETYA